MPASDRREWVGTRPSLQPTPGARKSVALLQRRVSQHRLVGIFHCMVPHQNGQPYACARFLGGLKGSLSEKRNVSRSAHLLLVGQRNRDRPPLTYRPERSLVK